MSGIKNYYEYKKKDLKALGSGIINLDPEKLSLIHFINIVSIPTPTKINIDMMMYLINENNQIKCVYKNQYERIIEFFDNEDIEDSYYNVRYGDSSINKYEYFKSEESINIYYNKENKEQLYYFNNRYTFTTSEGITLEYLGDRILIKNNEYDSITITNNQITRNYSQTTSNASYSNSIITEEINGIIIKKTYLEFDDNNQIKRIKTTSKAGVIVRDISIEYSYNIGYVTRNVIYLKNNLNKDKCMYVFDSALKLIGIYEGNNTDILSCLYTSYSSREGSTKEVYYNNKHDYYYFDNSGCLSYKLDNNGNLIIKSYSKHNDVTRIDYESKAINISKEIASQNNLIEDGYLDNIDEFILDSGISQIDTPNPEIAEYGIEKCLINNTFGICNIKKNLSVKTNGKDRLLYLMYVRSNDEISGGINIKISLSGGTYEAELFEESFDIIRQRNFLFMDMSILRPHTNITIEISTKPNIEIGALNLIKNKIFGTYYFYNDYNYLDHIKYGYETKYYNPFNKKCMELEDIGNVKRSVGTDSNGLLICKINEFDNYEYFIYGSNSYDRGIQVEHQVLGNNRYLSSKKEHNEYKLPTKNIGADLTITDYEYHNNDIKIKTIDDGNVKKGYTYNSFDSVSSIKFDDDNNKKIDNGYTGLKLTELSTAISNYTFTYDDDRIIEIRNNNNFINGYTYYVVNGNTLNLLSIENIFTSLRYRYSYDTDLNLTKIEKSTTAGSLYNNLALYEYDISSRLIKIIDSTTSKEKHFEYNADGNIKRAIEYLNGEESKIEKIYYQDDKVYQESISDEDVFLSRTSNTVLNSNISPLEAINKLSCYDNFVAFMQQNVEYGTNLEPVIYNYPTLYSKNQTCINASVGYRNRVSKEGLLNYITLNEEDIIYSEITLGSKNTIGLFFKTSVLLRNTLINISSGNSINQSAIVVAIDTNQCISVFVSDKNGNKMLVYQSQAEYRLNYWNLLVIKTTYLTNQYDDSKTDKTFELYLNGVKENINLYNQELTDMDISLFSNVKITIGGTFNYNTLSFSRFSGNLTGILLNKTKEISDTELYDYESFIREYVVDSLPNITSYSLSYINNKENKHISLNRGYESTSDDIIINHKTEKFENELSKPITFKYDKAIKRDVYSAFGNGLSYVLGTNYTMSISLSFKLMNVEKSIREIIRLKSNTDELMIYASENGKIYFKASNYLNHEFNVNYNEYYRLSLSINRIVVGDSMYEETYNLKITLNNSISTHTYNVTLDNQRLYIGGEAENAMFGYIENVEITKEYTPQKSIPIQSVKEYDDLKLLTADKVIYDDEEIIKTEFDYIKTSDNVVIPQIVSSITTTKSGNITSKSYTYQNGKLKTETIGDNIKEYSYNSNQITSYKNGNYEESYAYDNYGNITTKTINGVTYSYEYNGILSNQLTKYNNLNVNYYNDKSGRITGYGLNVFGYDGKDLISYANQSGSYEYTYNAYGQRIRKKDYIGKIINYEYMNDLLLYEKHNEYKLIFIYDDLNKIYGFNYISSTENKMYFYEYDITNNVIGIIDSNGNKVVEYEYNPWGNLISMIDTSNNNIGSINPIRYKGYYYDIESNLYYLKSRYYSPELCRFITPDSVDYLNQDFIVGINLYAYCGNDPVNYFDPSGHSPEWWQWLISGFEVAVGVALCFIPGTQGAGVTLIGTGAGSMINGYINQTNNGSFSAGWWGGQVSGLVSYIPGIGIPLGAFVGSITTDCIDIGWDKIDWDKALVTSFIAWGVSLFPAMIVEIASKYKIYDKIIYFVSIYNTLLTSTVNSVVNVYWRDKYEK